jgi:HSP20 family protein
MTDKRSPFDEIERLIDRMGDQFEDVDRWKGLEGAWPGGLNVDLVDLEEAFEVTADLPGFGTEDIEVELLDDQLRIRAERDQETETEEAGRYIRRERRERTVDRRVRLPEPVAEEEVEASFTNGVLTVTLPKAETAADTHSIDIE